MPIKNAEVAYYATSAFFIGIDQNYNGRIIDEPKYGIYIVMIILYTIHH